MLLTYYQNFIRLLEKFNGIPALLIRLILAPVFIMAGYSKLKLSDAGISGIDVIFAKPEIIEWFGNSQWGLGLPYAEVLANLAAWFEFFGGWLLLIGFLTRLLTIPLLFTMFVAASSVHAENGWFSITPTNSNISPAKVFDWLGFDSAQTSINNSDQTAIRLDRMRELLEENGNAEWLYEHGNIVVLNNGIEFSAIYFVLLLALFFIGAGRYTSIDSYLYNYFLKQQSLKNNNL